jgi:hypothetical protein
MGQSEDGMTGRNLEHDDDQSNASMSQSNYYQAQINEKRNHIAELKDKLREQEQIHNQINAS